MPAHASAISAAACGQRLSQAKAIVLGSESERTIGLAAASERAAEAAEAFIFTDVGLRKPTPALLPDRRARTYGADEGVALEEIDVLGVMLGSEPREGVGERVKLDVDDAACVGEAPRDRDEVGVGTKLGDSDAECDMEGVPE